MRISDWSSYVCSSDLIGNLRHTGAQIVERRQGVALVIADKRVEIRSDFVVRVNVERAARAAVVHRSRARQEDRNVVVVKRERRSEEHTSELQSLMRISYAVFCLKKKKKKIKDTKKKIEDDTHNRNINKETV